MQDRVFTSESVTEGHPDKVCDQISDAILDEIIGQDANARVACETLTTTGLVLVAGEVTTDYFADIQKTVRNTLEQIGYTDHEYGQDYQDCSDHTSIHEQSPDIAQGGDSSEEKEQGADAAGAAAEGDVVADESNATTDGGVCSNPGSLAAQVR